MMEKVFDSLKGGEEGMQHGYRIASPRTPCGDVTVETRQVVCEPFCFSKGDQKGMPLLVPISGTAPGKDVVEAMP